MKHRRSALSALLVSLVVLGGSSEATGKALECESIDEPLPFDNYWVGPGFEDLKLVSVTRVCAPGEIPVGATVEYLYQNCSPLDVGCEAPAELNIMSVPHIKGHRENIDRYGKKIMVEGVPGNFSGTQIALYFPGTTVFIGAGDAVVFGGGKDLWYRAARSLSKGSRVLADAARYGISFPNDCEDLVRCESEFLTPPGPSAPQIGLNIAGVLTFLFLFVVTPFLVLRRRGDQPLFSPEPRLWRLALGFLVAGLVVLFGLLRLSFVFVLPGLGLVVGAFLVGGAALRPRMSYPRGLVLGVVSYLFLGLMVRVALDWPQSLTELVNPERLGELGLMWPLFPALFLSGNLGG